MKTIRELLDGKVSNAVFAMVHGLRKQKERPDFEIRMETYGDETSVFSRERICYGCAATCAVQQIAGKDLLFGHVSGRHNRSSHLGFDMIDLGRFEKAIECLRCGEPFPLFRYMDADDSNVPSKLIIAEVSLPHMLTENWDNLVHVYERYAKLLAAEGM